MVEVAEAAAEVGNEVVAVIPNIVSNLELVRNRFARSLAVARDDIRHFTYFFPLSFVGK